MNFLQIVAAFPRLLFDGLQMRSPEDPSYNCIAFAAGDTDHWWWPDFFGGAYWPPGIQRSETLDAFMAAYGTLGYVQCPEGTVESGFEKICIYISPDNSPTHAALQLDDGRWTSKLGPSDDIVHASPEGVTGRCYGRIAAFMKRPRTPTP